MHVIYSEHVNFAYIIQHDLIEIYYASSRVIKISLLDTCIKIVGNYNNNKKKIASTIFVKLLKNILGPWVFR